MKPLGKVMDNFLEAHAPTDPRAGAIWWRARASMAQRGLLTIGDLIKNYDRFSDEERFCVMGFLGGKESRSFEADIESVRPELWAVLLNEITGSNALVQGVAGHAMAAFAKSDEITTLLNLLLERPDDGTLSCLIHALSWSRHLSDRTQRAEISMALRDILADRTARENLRATAAEGLVMTLRGLGRRSPVYKASFETLVNCLEEESILVRFFCIFALGCLGDRRTIPRLERIAREDQSICIEMPVGHRSVSQAARDAIDGIRHRTRG